MTIGTVRSKTLHAIIVTVVLCAGTWPAWAQERYDDHEITDRWYFTLGGFSQTEIRTTLRLDAKTPSGGLALGTVIALESQFDLDDQVRTGRFDGWYRFNARHRLGLTYWASARDGFRIYNGTESIDLGGITIDPGDSVTTKDDSSLLELRWTYSLVNTSKYEAWLGAGLNLQSIDTQIIVNVGGGMSMAQNSADGTVPIPTAHFGGRWQFSKRWRALVNQELFGIKVGDFKGKLSNTRILAEFDITRNFGIGGGFERYSFEVNAESDEFFGEMDTSYTGLSLYLKGQF